MLTLRKRSTWINPSVLYRRLKKPKCVVLKDPYMVLNNLLGHSTLDFMKLLLRLAYPWFQKIMTCKENNKGIMFITLYVDDIPLARNNVEMISAAKQ